MKFVANLLMNIEISLQFDELLGDIVQDYDQGTLRF